MPTTSKKKKKGGARPASAPASKETNDAVAAAIAKIGSEPKKAKGADSSAAPLPAVDTLATAGAATLRKIVLADETPTEDKLNDVQAEYKKLVEAAKRLESDRKTQIAKAADRDRLASELSRTRDVKERLEVLCRELQKQSKDVAEDAQQKRDALNEKFQTSIDDIQVKLQEQGAVQRDNEVLRKKLELIAKQTEIREQQYAAETRHKELEAELLSTQLAQASAKFQASEAEREVMGRNEVELREQLQLYADKFTGFQDTLTSSNDMFKCVSANQPSPFDYRIRR